MRQSANLVRKHIVVTGLVQGVGFRYFTVTQARRLGVQGWVRNCRDGSVELEAQGSSDAVQALVEQLAIGPRWSKRVTSPCMTCRLSMRPLGHLACVNNLYHEPTSRTIISRYG